MDKYISVKNLSYTYNKGTPLAKKALDNVSLDFNKGEFIALIGHTGSGKSTLVQHLNGLIKPDEGQIIIDNHITTNKGLKALRKKVGIVFQYPEHQLFDETVYKDIEFGLIKHGVKEDQRIIRIKETAKLLDIDDDMLKKSPYELSGGQKRRAAIAGILVLEPEILVLDEPVAGLDPSGCKELFKIVTKLYIEKGITVILVSHSMELVGDYANRVVVMKNGKVFMDGTPQEIFKKSDELEEIGLAVPQITKLMIKVKKKYSNVSDDIFTVEEATNELVKVLKNK